MSHANGDVCWLMVVASDAKLAFQETEARLRQELSDVKSDLQVKQWGGRGGGGNRGGR